MKIIGLFVFHHKVSSIFSLLVISSIPIYCQDSVELKIEENRKKNEKLESMAIFSKAQLNLLHAIDKHYKEIEDIKHERKDFPMSIAILVNRFGYPDETIILQNSNALEPPAIIWRYGKINANITLSLDGEKIYCNDLTHLDNGIWKSILINE